MKFHSGKLLGYMLVGVISMTAFEAGSAVTQGGSDTGGALGRILMPDNIAVDSCEIEHFGVEGTLCDGLRDSIHIRDAWRSGDGQTTPHWAELRFTNSVTIRGMAIHWNVLNGVAWSSRHYKIQCWEGDAKKGVYKDVIEVKGNPSTPFTLSTLGEITTDRIRVWQPAGGGPSGNSNLLWIAELEVYDHARSASEFGTASDKAQQMQIQAESRARTIGVYKRSRHNNRTRAFMGILSKLGKHAVELDRLDERELRRCKMVVLAGPRFIPSKDVILDYIHNGGAVMLLYDACGRSGGSLAPDLWEYAGMGGAELVVKDKQHPIAGNLPERFAHAYGNHALIKARGKGAEIVADAEGNAVVVAGQFGDGRVVAMGNFPGLACETNWANIRTVSPAGGEFELVKNSIAWLSEGALLKQDWRESSTAARLRKEGKLKRYQFTDITKASGTTYQWYSKAAALADVHETGRLDIFGTLCGPPFDRNVDHNLFYRNDGNLIFTEMSKEAGIREPPGIGCVFGDVNGDGHLDLFVCWMEEMGNKGRNALFLGDGQGRFRDVTDAAGLGKTGPSAQCMMSDLDNDGDLDLYIVGNGVDNTLWRNRGNGIFEDATKEYGLVGIGSEGEKGYGSNLAAVIADLDGDGFQDLVCFSRSTLLMYRNKGGKTFEAITEYMGPGKPAITGGSLGIALGDIDHDGDLDLYAAGCNALLRNDGSFRFADVTRQSGLDQLERNIHVYCPVLADWDNDGWLDLYLGSGAFDSFAYHNNGNFTFTDVTGMIGLDAYSIHGCCFGDLDGDGDLDFYGTTWSQYDFKLLRNNQDDKNFLKVRVKGKESNTSGIGAKVWVYDEAGKGKERLLMGYSEVLGGGGAMYTCPVLEQHFGVPASGKYTVDVLFPASGKRVTLPGVAASQVLTVEEP